MKCNALILLPLMLSPIASAGEARAGNGAGRTTVVQASLPGFRSVQFDLQARTMALQGEQGQVEVLQIDDRIDLLPLVRPARARFKSDPYPCDLSPCQSGRIVWNPETSTWGPGASTGSGEYYDANGPIGGGDGLTPTETDMIRWLNWHQGVCASIPGPWGLEGQYIALLATAVAACGSAETGVGTVFCAAAISAAAALGVTLDQARGDCDSSYSFGAGG